MAKWADRGSASSRGYGYAWQKLREQILTRDCGLCQPCLKAGHTTSGNEVDHIRPKSKGGYDHPSNLQTICVECHKRKTAEDEGKARRQAIGADGWPLA